MLMTAVTHHTLPMALTGIRLTGVHRRGSCPQETGRVSVQKSPRLQYSGGWKREDRVLPPGIEGSSGHLDVGNLDTHSLHAEKFPGILLKLVGPGWRRAL